MSLNQEVIAFLQNNTTATKYYINEDMKKHTTFKTGGAADLLVEPGSISDLQNFLRYLIIKKVPYVILGHGSNVLVGDGGIREIVLKIEKNLSATNFRQETAEAEAGALLSDVAKEAQKQGLSGLEFASGIPGTVGGAVVMNAGAYGGEIKDVLEEVVVLTREGEIKTRKTAELELGYRTSIIQRNGDLVLKAKFKLKPGDPEEILNTMNELTRRREQSQPLEYPSAGSTFKRPPGYYTGKLIQEAGLMGYRIGGAQVSTKHAGFVINAGNATTSDVLNLIRHIQQEIKRRNKVDLEMEVKVLGEL